MAEESKSLADLVNAPVVLDLPGMQDVKVHSNRSTALQQTRISGWTCTSLAIVLRARALRSFC